jgi:hypothetical protein
LLKAALRQSVASKRVAESVLLKVFCSKRHGLSETL